MSLVKQNFEQNDIKLSFYSFVHPSTGELWMSGSDIAKSLGYSDYNTIIWKTVTSNDKIKWTSLIKGLEFTISLPKNWQPATMMINESGLYSLFMRSKLKKSSSMKQFIKDVVLNNCKMPIINQYANWLNLQEDEIISSMNEEIDGYFYITTTVDLEKRNIYKFGSTINLDGRIKQLNVSSPFDYYYCYVFKTKHFRKLEKFMLKSFETCKLQREFVVLHDKYVNMHDICNTFVESL